MKLLDLLDDANHALYLRVSAQINLQIEPDDDWRGEAWNARLIGNTGIISYCHAPFPKAMFARELLKLEAQLKGFRPLRFGIALHQDIQQRLPEIVKAFNFLFLHRKIWQHFLDLGYPPNHFSEDPTGSEAQASFRFLVEQLADNERSLLSFTRLYLSFLQLEPQLPETQQSALQQQFEQYQAAAYQANIRAMHQSAQKWANNNSYQAQPFMLEMLVNMGISDTWFSYLHDTEQQFPNEGFFVGNPFDIIE